MSKIITTIKQLAYNGTPISVLSRIYGGNSLTTLIEQQARAEIEALHIIHRCDNTYFNSPLSPVSWVYLSTMSKIMVSDTLAPTRTTKTNINVRIIAS